MEVVVNRCFGGFGLSTLGIAEILKKKGKKAYCYKQTKYSFRDGNDEYTKVAPNANSTIGEYVLSKDYGDTIVDIPWDEKDDDGDKVVNLFCSYDTDRTDKYLIEVVNELGTEASGNFSALEVVFVPDGIEWEISNYDGIEHAEERHRSW